MKKGRAATPRSPPLLIIVVIIVMIISSSSSSSSSIISIVIIIVIIIKRSIIVSIDIRHLFKNMKGSSRDDVRVFHCEYTLSSGGGAQRHS